jgi:hypothetical protein
LTTDCGCTNPKPARMVALTATRSDVKNTERSASTMASSPDPRAAPV